jgi:hypothetical protein
LLLACLVDRVPGPFYAAYWIRLALLWVLVFGVMRGKRWAWAPALILCAGYCVVATILVAAGFLRQIDVSIFNSGTTLVGAVVGAGLMAGCDYRIRQFARERDIRAEL